MAFYAGIIYAFYAGPDLVSGAGAIWYLCVNIQACYANLFTHFMPVYSSIYRHLCRYILAFYAGLFTHFMPVYSSIISPNIQAIYAGPE
jgi:hypothetical protein